MAEPYQIIAKMYKIRVNQPGFGPRIISFFASDLQAQDLVNQTCFFTGTGAPSTSLSSTNNLPAGNGAYIIGDLWFDSQGKVLYICNQGGTNVTSQWQPISNPGFLGDYNPLNSYPQGCTIRVPNLTVYNGVTVYAGIYAAAINVPAINSESPSNQIPQFPEPLPTPCWRIFTFLPNMINQSCGSGVAGWVNATNPVVISSN